MYFCTYSVLEFYWLDIAMLFPALLTRTPYVAIRILLAIILPVEFKIKLSRKELNECIGKAEA